MGNRFVRMPGGDSDNLDSSPEGSELQQDWGWELFKVVNDKNDERNVALWSPDHERFVRMPPQGTDRMDRSSHHGVAEMRRALPFVCAPGMAKQVCVFSSRAVHT